MASSCDVVKPSNLDFVSSDEGNRSSLRCAGKLAINYTHNKLVCVTSGNSCLGAQIVMELLAHGYLVRVTIQNPVEFEDLEKMMKEVEISKLESVVVAKMGNVESLCNAFRGCVAVFHTSSFIDPHGISGYSETMAFLEMEGAKNVVEACGKEISVRRCVFTSSLLASIWVGNNLNDERVIDESCWSNEEFCRDNKLWVALGKTRAEKIAWQKSKEMKVNLVTVCPGLIIAPSSPNSNTKRASFPYLKGAPVMLSQGKLATVDVRQAAKAHLHIFKAMDCEASGRYHCFDWLIRNSNDAILLESELKSPGLLMSRRQDEYNVVEVVRSKLSNSKLVKLIAGEASRFKSCQEV